MFGFYFISFKEYMLAGKTLWDYTNAISLNDPKKKIITNLGDLSRGSFWGGGPFPI